MSRAVAILVAVWGALLALLALTVALAHVDLGGANAAVALAVAGVKAVLVLVFFMELRRSDLATRSTAATGFLLLAALCTLLLADYLARGAP